MKRKANMGLHKCGKNFKDSKAKKDLESSEVREELEPFKDREFIDWYTAGTLPMHQMRLVWAGWKAAKERKFDSSITEKFLRLLEEVNNGK